MAYTPPAPDQLATDLAQGVGDQVVDTAVSIAPIAVPFVLALTALSWALRKFGVGGTATLTGAKAGQAYHGGMSRYYGWRAGRAERGL